jgi:hypothetical protein
MSAIVKKVIFKVAEFTARSTATKLAAQGTTCLK